MTPLHFGHADRLLFGFHHPAEGAVRQTAVLICGSWSPEAMRCYRGTRTMAQQLAATGFETLRFDYSGTGDSQGEGLETRLEHWLQDIILAAQELRDISGRRDIAVLGLRFGALLAAAAKARLGLDSRLHIYWDAPESGATYISLMQQLSEELDSAKRWRRNRDMQLPTPDVDELYGHPWPAPLAEAIATLTLPAADPQQLWFVSSDMTAPITASGDTVLASGDAGHWHEVAWVHTPWVPVAAAKRLAQHLAKVLP